MDEPSRDVASKRFIKIDGPFILRFIYSKKIISVLFCFVFLILRLIGFDLYYTGGVNKTLDSLPYIIDRYFLASLFYGFLCAWVFKKTYLDKPNPSYFFIGSVILAAAFLVWYWQFVTGVQGSIRQWGVDWLRSGKIQLPLLIWILINPLNFMAIIAGIVFIKARYISRKEK